MVDAYYCGAPIGTLTVKGVIAQKFRGPVGRGGTSPSNGYVKDYVYDPRLQFRAPPHFLDPVESAWRVWRYTEQQPSRHARRARVGRLSRTARMGSRPHTQRR